MEADPGVVVGAPHESASSHFRRMLDVAAAAAVQAGGILADRTIVDSRLKPMDFGHDLCNVRCVVEGL